MRKFITCAIILLAILFLSFYDVIAQEGSNTVFLPLVFHGSDRVEPTPDPTIPPSAFNKISPTNYALDQPKTPILSWETTSPLTEYEYCIYELSEFNCSNWISTGTSNSVELPALEPNTFYKWQVRAWNGVQGPIYANGTEDETWAFITGDLPFVYRSEPDNGATNLSTTLLLEWFGSSDATSYEYCFDTINDYKCNNWTSTGTRNYVGIGGLVEGTTYYWHVRALNEFGTAYSDSDETKFWSFRTASNVPNTPILNGDFESGELFWDVHSKNGYDIVKDITGDVLADPPPSGSWAADFWAHENEYAYVSQAVEIPPTGAILHFWYYSWSLDIDSGYDYFIVRVGEDALVVEDLYGDETTEWVHKEVDLSAYAGTIQRIRFSVGCDYSLSSGLYLDDISLVPIN